MKRIPILMYHSISQHAQPKFRPFVVSLALFAAHMAYLYQQAYTPLTVTQFISRQSDEDDMLPERPVIITFDDGYEDFLTNALPILQEYRFAATLYIVTKFVNGRSEWLRREGETERPMLTWHQLAEVSASGIECGGHSHSHRQLDTLSLASVRSEIVACKKRLEDHLGKEVCSFAYPYGYCSSTVKKLVREAGFTSACAVRHMLSSTTDDRFALARLMVGADTDVETLGALLSGGSSSVITTLYRRARTPVWQLVRRSSAMLAGQRQNGVRKW